MSKRNLLTALAAIMLAACTGGVDSLHDDLADVTETTAVSAGLPVSFDAYVDRATTRAGATGELTTNTSTGGKVSMQAQGFGVFAYYTDDKPYTPAYQPNFMYNTKVSGSGWTYSPTRYWPNETGSASGAAGVDRLSFFAYAPYTEVTPATGMVTGNDRTGIVGMTRNAAAGDPMVRYNCSFKPNERVDLCWGVANANYTSSADGTLKNNIAEDAPYVDMLKPATGTGNKINFNFRHALAALNVQIDADVDVVNAHTGSDNHSTAVDGQTRIYIRSVTFEGFATKGALNLNATKAAGPRWLSPSYESAVSTAAVTVHDGRSDGKEAVGVAMNEEITGLNPDLVQSEPYLNADYTSNSGNVKAGVTNTAVNLFDVSGVTAETPLTAPVYLIPNGVPLKIRIVYDVETQSSKLPGYLGDGRTKGSAIENDISKTLDVTMQAGKLYTVKIHLGMTSVKFDTPTVDEWGSATTATPPYITGVQSIGFTASMAEMDRAVTRAYGSTEITGDASLNNKGGFGVFAAYTGLHKYSDSDVTTDYMYNQQVKKNSAGTAWTYEPVLYWPEGEGDAGTPTGANPHYVSFFAYAPYSDTGTDSPATNPAGYCIPSFSYAHERTDPWLTYRLIDQDNLSRQVDLLYARPLLDQVKPATGDKLTFEFRHALACVGDQVTVKLGSDMQTGVRNLVTGGVTKAEVRLTSVSVTYKLTEKGRLVLRGNGDEPNWKPIMSENFTTRRTVSLLSGGNVTLYSYNGSSVTTNTTWTDSGNGVFYIPIEAGGDTQTATVSVGYSILTTKGSVNTYTKTGSAVVVLSSSSYADAYKAGKHLYINVELNDASVP